MPGHLLVTGFGPFPSMARNPSAGAARAVAASPRWRVLGIEVRLQVLTTAYAAITTELEPALTERPAAVLMIGVAGRSRRIRVERRGTARRSTLFPDRAGEMAHAPMTRLPPRWTTAPAEAARLVFMRHGLPARLSRDAGRYLCNAAYFHALGPKAAVLFIHIPKPSETPRPGGRRMTLKSDGARLDAALVEVARLLMRAR